MDLGGFKRIIVSRTFGCIQVPLIMNMLGLFTSNNVFLLRFKKNEQDNIFVLRIQIHCLWVVSNGFERTMLSKTFGEIII